jgi:hypothetical protein
MVEYHWTFTGTNTGPGGTGSAVRIDADPRRTRSVVPKKQAP